MGIELINNSTLTGTLTVSGNTTLSTIPSVGSDTDKFLMSNGGLISFATGAEVLSYIGAGTGSVTGTGTAGTVTKWSAGGTGIEDGPITFSTNDSTFGGNVLIGTSTTTPSVHYDNLVIEDVAGNNVGISLISGTANNTALYFGDSADTDIGQLKYSHATNDMFFVTNAVTALTIDSSQDATFAGTLSAGATTLSSTTNLLLTLNPTAGNYGGILFQYGGVTKGLSYYNSGLMIFGGEAGIPTRIQAGGGYGLHIDATNQNVHIGATSDTTYKLQVTGTFYTSSDATFAGAISANKRLLVTTDGTYAYGINVSSSDQSHARIRITNTGASGETYSMMVGTHGANNTGFAIRNETDATTPLQFDTSDNATFAGTVSGTTATFTTFSGDLNGTINTVTTAVTKGNAVNDTTVATTAFVQNVVGTIPAGLVFQGTWNASTNTPTLASGTGTTGNFYIVSVAGTTNLDGITDWEVGDWAVFIEQGASDQWEKIDNSSVLSGSGTGQSVTKWDGSGTSVTLADGPITFSTNDATFAGAIFLDGFTNPTTQYLSFRDAFVPSASGGIGLMALDHSGSSNDGLALYGHDGISMFTAQTERMRIDSSGNVGIGDASPQGKLEVNNRDTATGAALFIKGGEDDLDPIAGQYTGLAFGYGGGDIYNNAAILWEFTATNATGKLHFAVNPTAGDGTADLSDSKMTILDSGNVGIGTPNPGYKLQVTGVQNANDIVINNSTTGVNLRMQSNDAVSNIFTTGAIPLTFGTNNAEKMRITSAGNVGIGTTSPSAKLDVQSSGAWSTHGRGASGDINVENTNTAVTEGGWISVSGYMNNAANGGFYQMGAISAKKSTAAGDGDYGGDLSFWTTSGGAGGEANSGGYQRMTIDSTGNVGIGTDDPLTKLHIAGATDANIIRLENTGTALSSGDTIGAIQFFNNDTTDDSPNVAASIYATAGASGGSGSLRFKTIEPGVEGDPATEAMIITNGGYVGIGTTSPGVKLEVEGGTNAIIKMNSTSGTGGRMDFAHGGATYGNVGSGKNILGTGNAADMMINADSLLILGVGSQDMTILPSGNVGIGVTAPSVTLEVSGSATIGAESVTSTTTNYENKLRVQGKNNYSDGVTWYGTYGQILLHSDTNMTGSARMFLITNALDSNKFAIVRSVDGSTDPVVDSTAAGVNSGTADFVIDNAGNVGIGTTSPGQKLTIENGTFQITGTSTFAGNVEIGRVGSDNNLAFATGGTERMRINSTGNVGIGTTSPFTGAELDVFGDVVLIEKNWALRGNNANADLCIEELSGTVFSDANVKLTVKSGGNVGIGTTSPNARLSLGDATGQQFYVYEGGNVRAGLGVDMSGSSRELSIFNSSSNGITGNISLGYRHETGGAYTENMRINSGGNVSIGNTNNTYELDVTGAGRFTGTVHSNKLEYGGSSSTYLEWGINSIALATGSTSALSINSSQNVFIGAGSLTVTTSTVTATNFILSSDERSKENIKVLEPKKIETDWKTFNIKDSDEGYRVGVIAQELEIKHPEFVETNDEGFKSVKYIDLLISKIAELEDRIKQLEK